MAFPKAVYHVFIDGNHENYDRLSAYPVTEWRGGKVHRIADNILHLMRGQVFEIDGVRYQLEINENDNNIHSSMSAGFHKQLWEAESCCDDSVSFHYRCV